MGSWRVHPRSLLQGISVPRILPARIGRWGGALGRSAPFVLLAASATASPAGGAESAGEPSGAGEWELEEAPGGHSFFYKEVVLSLFYSPEGVADLPPADECEDHFEISPRPPGSYIGFDFVRTSAPPARRGFLGRWLPLTAVDFHPRVVLDRMEREGDPDRVKFAPQDLWLRFNPGEIDRLLLRVGQFVLPYGVNPILAPRQRFLLPLEAVDLGLKWDWGIDLKGPLRSYEWEIAATIGSGEAFHSPHLFEGSRRTSSLGTARIGTPPYWDFQYGLSFLYGDLPLIRAARRLSQVSVSRWRAALDTVWKYGTYLMMGGQLSYGRDGFAGDHLCNMFRRDAAADVFGYRAWVDWVVPQYLDLRIAAQFESVIRDLGDPDSDDTAAILEMGYSMTTAVMLRFDYRKEIHRTMGDSSDAIFLTIVYYAR